MEINLSQKTDGQLVYADEWNLLIEYLRRATGYEVKTAAQWDAQNPKLGLGVFGIISETRPVRFKVGDGINRWKDIPLEVPGKGDKGEAFKYTDFTPEQLEALRGPAGRDFKFTDFTPAQLEALKVKGDKGSNGWTPAFVLVTKTGTDGVVRTALQLKDYVGGEGSKPTNGVGQYVGPNGYVAFESATNLASQATTPTNPTDPDPDPTNPVPGTATKMKDVGFPYGAAIKISEVEKRPTTYGAHIIQEFSKISSENDAKWEKVETSLGTFNFSNIKKTLDFCKANNIKYHWHAIVWAMKKTAELEALRGTPNAKQKITDIVRAHVRAIANFCNTNYPGIVTTVDAVNEPFTNGGNYIDGETGPNGEIKRTDVWYSIMGPDYIEQVIKIVNEEWPQVETYINDYGQEYATGRMNALIGMKAKCAAIGARLDGIGFQLHNSLSMGNSSQRQVENFQACVKKCDNAGLKVQVTEYDLKLRRGLENNGPNNDGVIPGEDGVPEYPFVTTDTTLRNKAKVILDHADVSKRLLIAYMTALRPSLRAGWISWAPSDRDSNINLAQGHPVDYPTFYWADYKPKPAVQAWIDQINKPDPYVAAGTLPPVTGNNPPGSAEIYDDFRVGERSNAKGTQTNRGTIPKVWGYESKSSVEQNIKVTTAGLIASFSSNNQPGHFVLDPLASDYDVSTTLGRRKAGNSTNIAFALIFRFLSNDNYWYARIRASTAGSQWELIKRVAGTETSMAMSPSDAKNGDVVKISAIGSTIKFYVNNTLIQTITDSALQTATKAGFRLKGQIDNYSSALDFRLDIQGSTGGPVVPVDPDLPPVDEEPPAQNIIEIADTLVSATATNADGTVTNAGVEKPTWKAEASSAGFGIIRRTSNGLQANGTASTTFTYLTLDTGVNDFKMKAKLAARPAANQTSFYATMVIRYVDVRNYIYLRANNSTENSFWQVKVRVNDVDTAPLIESKTNAAVNDVVEVTVIGEEISLHVNGVLVGRGISTSLMGGTRAGFRFRGLYDTVTAWKDLEIDKYGITDVEPEPEPEVPVEEIPDEEEPLIADFFAANPRTDIANTQAIDGARPATWRSIYGTSGTVYQINSLGLVAKAGSVNTSIFAVLDTGKTSYRLVTKVARKTTALVDTIRIAMVFRFKDSSNYFTAQVMATATDAHWAVNRYSTGNPTQELLRHPVDAKTGDEVEVIVTPTTITLIVNGTEVGTVNNSSDAALTEVGFRGNGQRDNWSTMSFIKVY